MDIIHFPPLGVHKCLMSGLQSFATSLGLGTPSLNVGAGVQYCLGSETAFLRMWGDPWFRDPEIAWLEKKWVVGSVDYAGVLLLMPFL